MRKLKTGLIVITSISLSSCAGQAWSSEEQDQFIAECKEEGGSAGYCDCYLEK